MLAPNPTMQPPMAAPPEQPTKYHDVTIVTKREYECARVEGVPPEEFGISRRAKSIRDAHYCFHDLTKSQSDLIAQGYDAEQIKKLPSYTISHTVESMARDTVNEGTQSGGDDGINKSSRNIRITEHYIRMDYEGDDEGKARLYRVTTGGEDAEILTRDGEPDIIEEDVIPFAAMTPVIVTHRFFGRSAADLVMDIQRIKTALLRGLLDNTYLRNNPRTEIAESHCGDSTLDDLLVSRPGGLVRTRMPGGLNVFEHPDVATTIYPAIQYMDATREWRTGVSRQGQGVDPNALQNQVATIANQMFNASQAKVKLIARIFAETGIRDLFSLLHATVRKHGTKAQTVRLRNEWVEVDPREWKNRDDMTVKVGLGDGSKPEQLAGVQLLIAAQEKAVAAQMVSRKNLYNSAQILTKLLGHKNVDEFFTSPDKPPDPNDPSSAPIPPPEDPKMKELQAKNEIEKTQAQADIATNDRKAQADMAMSDRKLNHEMQLATMKFELDSRLAQEKHALEMEKLRADVQVKAVTAAVDVAHKHEAHATDVAATRETHQVKTDAARESHDMKMEQAKAKPKPAK